MAILILKFTMTPLMIGAASLGARRWGSTIGGWLVSLPLTSGPVALFLALTHGPAFGAEAAQASLAGSLAIVGYCVAWARVAGRRSWRVALLAAALGWIVGALVAEGSLGLPVGILFGLVGLVWLGGMRLMPGPPREMPGAIQPAWELPLRMAIGTFVVVVVTALASFVGPSASGLLAMVPVIGTVLVLFAQLREGTSSGVGLLRGILAGLFGTAAFLGVVSVTLVPLGIAGSFAAALLTITLVQVVAVRALRAETPAVAAS